MKKLKTYGSFNDRIKPLIVEILQWLRDHMGYNRIKNIWFFRKDYASFPLDAASSLRITDPTTTKPFVLTLAHARAKFSQLWTGNRLRLSKRVRYARQGTALENSIGAGVPKLGVPRGAPWCFVGCSDKWRLEDQHGGLSSRMQFAQGSSIILSLIPPSIGSHTVSEHKSNERCHYHQGLLGAVRSTWRHCGTPTSGITGT